MSEFCYMIPSVLSVVILYLLAGRINLPYQATFRLQPSKTELSALH